MNLYNSKIRTSHNIIKECVSCSVHLHQNKIIYFSSINYSRFLVCRSRSGRLGKAHVKDHYKQLIKLWESICELKFISNRFIQQMWHRKARALISAYMKDQKQKYCWKILTEICLVQGHLIFVWWLLFTHYKSISVMSSILKQKGLSLNDHTPI
jgi:hypothetical protein